MPGRVVGEIDGAPDRRAGLLLALVNAVGGIGGDEKNLGDYLGVPATLVAAVRRSRSAERGARAGCQLPSSSVGSMRRIHEFTGPYPAPMDPRSNLIAYRSWWAWSSPAGLPEPVPPATIPAPVVVAFFVLNVIGVSLTAYLLLQYSVRERDAALAVSDGLLLNVLPRSIADRLKHAPGVIADRHDNVTVLFADIADFTPFAERTALSAWSASSTRSSAPSTT